MGKKEDWEELEKWNKDHEDKIVKEYGDNIEKLGKKTKKSQKTIKKLNKTAEIIGKIIIGILSTIIIICVMMLFSYWKGINEQTNINVVDTLQNMYGKKIKIVSQNLDDHKNGTYVLETKTNPKITFHAEKEYGSFKDDYSNQCMKYYYENWDSTLKNKFTPEEKISDTGIVDYRLYANINSFDDIDSIVDTYVEFKEFSKEYYFEDWNIWVRSGTEYKDILVSGTGYTIDQIKDRLKEDYVTWATYNKISDKSITTEIINKYYNEETLHAR